MSFISYTKFIHRKLFGVKFVVLMVLLLIHVFYDGILIIFIIVEI